MSISKDHTTPTGGDGRGAAEPAQRHQGPARHARRVHSLHNPTGRRAHARADDQHVHTAEHRGDRQPAQRVAGARVAARAPALVHRGRLGVLHAARPHTVPGRDRDPVLGEVLRPERDRRLVGLRGAHPGDDSLPGLRHTLLHVAGDAQVRGDGHRHQGAGVAQGTDRNGRPRRPHEQYDAVGPKQGRVIGLPTPRLHRIVYHYELVTLKHTRACLVF